MFELALTYILFEQKNKISHADFQDRIFNLGGLYNFAKENAPDVAKDIRSKYTSHLHELTFSTFRSEHNSLVTFKKDVATKSDLIVPEKDALKKFGLSLDFKKGKDIHALALGDRARILDINYELPTPPSLSNKKGDLLDKQLDKMASSLHLVKDKDKMLYEIIFFTLQKNLMNSVLKEFKFIRTFFGADHAEVFDEVFGKTLSYSMDQLGDHVSPFSLLNVLRRSQ